MKNFRVFVEQNNPSKREQGTDSLVRIYKKDTPGEDSDKDRSMKSFKEYVIEDVKISNAFEKAKQNSQYIKSEKYKQLYLQSLDSLIAAANSREIYNARFKESKSHLIRGLEYSYDGMFNQIKDDLIKNNQETADLWSIYSLTEINKKIKIYNSMKPKNDVAVTFMDNIKDLPDAVKNMKQYIKSGKEPKIPKPGQFVKPLSSPDAVKMSIKFMEDVSNTFKTKLEKEISSNFKSTYNKIKDITDPKELPKNGETILIASTIFISRGYGKNKTLELIKDSDKRVNKIIEDTVSGIIDKFIQKNAKKLSLILQKKERPKEHNILRTNIRNGLVENTMKFTFNDGSSFVLESSVMYKTSSQGKYFIQYPTRFKNVILSDGSKMKMPSEEKMIKDF